MTATDLYLHTFTTIILEYVCICGIKVHISSHIITTIYITMNMDIFIGCSTFCADIDINCLLDITHHTATEYILTVNRCNIDIGLQDRVILTSTKDTASKCTTTDSYIGFTYYLAFITTANNIHNRLTRNKVQILFTLNTFRNIV